MTEEQKLEIIAIDTLLARTREFHAAGYRLVQIGATRAEGIELNYSFDKDYHFVNLRVAAPADVPVPSISGIYWNAFLYENEIHDLFGIAITGIAVDYEGKFMRTAVRAPFGDKQ